MIPVVIVKTWKGLKPSPKERMCPNSQAARMVKGGHAVALEVRKLPGSLVKLNATQAEKHGIELDPERDAKTLKASAEYAKKDQARQAAEKKKREAERAKLEAKMKDQLKYPGGKPEKKAAKPEKKTAGKPAPKKAPKKAAK